MTLKREYDDMPGEFRHLIANSDEEIRELEQAAHPPQTDFTLPTSTTLSAAESARITQQIESNALIAELLGIESRSILEVDATPLGVDGRPLNKSAEDELRSSFQRLISAVVTGVQQGDPDALALIESGRSRMLATEGLMENFKWRAAEMADDVAPSIAPFVKAWAAGDHAAMRRAVRPIAEELVATGAA